MSISADALHNERAHIVERLNTAQQEAHNIRTQLQGQQEVLSRAEQEISTLQDELNEIKQIKLEVLSRESDLEIRLQRKEGELGALQQETTQLAQTLGPAFQAQKRFEEALKHIDDQLQRVVQSAHVQSAHGHRPVAQSQSAHIPRPALGGGSVGGGISGLPKPPSLSQVNQAKPSLGGGSIRGGISGLPKPPSLSRATPPTANANLNANQSVQSSTNQGASLTGGISGLPKPPSLSRATPPTSNANQNVNQGASLAGGISGLPKPPSLSQQSLPQAQAPSPPQAQLNTPTAVVIPSSVSNTPPVQSSMPSSSEPSDDVTSHDATQQSQSFVAESTQPASYSRRRKATRKRPPRVALNIELQYELKLNQTSDHNFYTGFTNNISEGGLFIATEELIDIGSHLTFQLHLPSMQESHTVEGVVRWVRERSSMNESLNSGMGIEFINLTPALQAQINSFIDQRESIFYEE